jgi:hypothetical protein
MMLKSTDDHFSCPKEHVAVPAPPLVDPQPHQPSDRVLLRMALGVLHRMATEQTGWRSFFRRWYYSDEPLRNDAANIVRAAQFEMPRPEGTRLVGDPR